MFLFILFCLPHLVRFTAHNYFIADGLLIDIERIGQKSQCYTGVFGRKPFENSASAYYGPRRMPKIPKRLSKREKTCVSKVSQYHIYIKQTHTHTQATLHKFIDFQLTDRRAHTTLNISFD